MHTLYDSDTFAVMHVLANAPGDDAAESSEPVLARHGFEIVDEIGGNEARCHLFSLGHLWRGYVSIVARKPDGRIVYTVGKPSEHVEFPAPEIRDALNAAEGLSRANGWNGSDIVFGSSREGSVMPWTQVRDVVESVLDARENR